MMTPQEAATHTGEIKKGWISYRDIAIKNYKRRTSFQINAYLWEHKLFHKGTDENPISFTITMGRQETLWQQTIGIR